MSQTEKPKSKKLRVVRSDQGLQREAKITEPDTPAGSEGACPHCFGTGMEVVPGVGARRCRCQSPDHRSRLFQAARIPPRYQHCPIQNYVTGDTETSKWVAKIEADRIINDFLISDGRGLLFVGPVGVGKTHLAV